jgi:phosphoribosylamine--glycine ligase
MQKIEEKVVKPTISGLQKEGIAYKGFIFIGIMNVGGNPYVIEYNVRMGDPETQAVMPRIKSDLVELFIATAKGDLKNQKIEIDPNAAVAVVMVSGGYPDDYEKGKVISGLDGNHKALVFHAGTKQADQKVLTDGGRVLAITGTGESLKHAREQAFADVAAIQWDGIYFRKDIGLDLLKLSQ